MALVTMILVLGLAITTSFTTFAAAQTSTGPAPSDWSLQVSSVDQNGGAIGGLYVSVWQGGTMVQSGFTPYFSTVAQLLELGSTYVVTAGSYGGCTFSHWLDTGSTDPSRSILVTSSNVTTANTSLHASYVCAQSTLKVVVQHPDGSPADGILTQVAFSLPTNVAGPQASTPSSDCFSQCSFTVDNGQTYQVKVDDYGDEVFSHWSDNQGYSYPWGGLHPVTIPAGSANTTVTLTAIYGVPLPPLNLTVIGVTGKTVVLNSTEVAALASQSGVGGLRTKAGAISNVGNYTGIPLMTLLGKVGDISPGESVNVTGSDGYTIQYSYQQVASGTGYNTYNPQTGAPEAAGAQQPLSLLLAYSVNGTQPGTEGNGGTGPLRTVIVGPQGLVTDGDLWVKWVVTIQIIPSSS
jgi:Oxidoreductase molybdopterin binding domain